MNTLILIMITLVGSQLTHYLNHKYHWGAVRISGGLTLLFLFMSWEFNLLENFAAAFLGSTFLGMSDKEIFSARDIFFGNWIYLCIFLFVLPFNIGLGGALGTAAFVTCGIIRGCKLLVNKYYLSSFKNL